MTGKPEAFKPRMDDRLPGFQQMKGLKNKVPTRECIFQRHFTETIFVTVQYPMTAHEEKMDGI